MIKIRQDLDMDQAHLPIQDDDVRGLALAAHLLHERLHALMPDCSEINALKLDLAIDMDHVSPEVRTLLGLATIDLMASANEVAARVADAVLANEVAEPAVED